MVMVGLVIGIPVALAMARLISAMLFGINEIDLVTIAVATLIMIFVSRSFLREERRV